MCVCVRACVSCVHKYSVLCVCVFVYSVCCFVCVCVLCEYSSVCVCCLCAWGTARDSSLIALIKCCFNADGYETTAVV